MSTARTAEATMFLEVIQATNNKIQNMINATLPIALGNRVVWRMSHGGLVMLNYCNKDAAVESSAIERMFS